MRVLGHLSITNGTSTTTQFHVYVSIDKAREDQYGFVVFQERETSKTRELSSIDAYLCKNCVILCGVWCNTVRHYSKFSATTNILSKPKMIKPTMFKVAYYSFRRVQEEYTINVQI